eukprot:TRINITY_DN4789_c0_g1_i2.p1 TRINITY_DN4789_c0_g1~~TRINITY_DN4789_c0_g1_i2.p1  ORF type:complete len:434 (+),score=72.63 TRINITY_DN4789_c0_g1_i2:130-1431(+)
MAEWREPGEDAALAAIVRSGDGSSLVTLLRSRAAAGEAEVRTLLEAALESMQRPGALESMQSPGNPNLPRSLLGWRMAYVLTINDLLDHEVFAQTGDLFMYELKKSIFQMLVPSKNTLCLGGSRGILSIINVADPKVQLQVEVEPEETIEAIAWSPSRLQVAVAIYESWAVVDAATGQIDMKVACGDFVMDVAWSPIGSKLAVCTGGTDAAPGMLRLVDIASGFAEGIFECDVGIRFVAWSPSGSYVAASARNGYVYVVDVARGQCIIEQSLLGEDTGEWIANISWIPGSSKLAATSLDGVLKVWGMPSGLLVDEKRNAPRGDVAPQGPAISMKNKPCGIAPGFQSALVFRAEGETDVFCLTDLGSTNVETLRQTVDDFAWSPDGTKLALAYMSAGGVALSTVDASAIETGCAAQQLIQIDGCEQCFNLAWCV